MTNSAHYVIRGGLEGRERLRVLGRVMRPSTLSLFDRLGLVDGLTCLDIGCGGGDATLDLARRVAPRGTVVGVDVDETKIRLARAEAAEQGVTNVEFRVAGVSDLSRAEPFDVVYARFLLTHLSDPAKAVTGFYEQLHAGGTIAIEDIDFSGYFIHPELPAFRRYHDFYCASVIRRGGDPNIGPRLPTLLKHTGFENIGAYVVQPVGLEGEVKLLTRSRWRTSRTPSWRMAWHREKKSTRSFGSSTNLPPIQLRWPAHPESCKRGVAARSRSVSFLAAD